MKPYELSSPVLKGESTGTVLFDLFLLAKTSQREPSPLTPHFFYLFFSQVLIMAQNGSILYPYFSNVTCGYADDCYEKTFEGG